ncbi:MAG: hypothetical protein PVH68_06000 [Armatimonadota bacterium]|jgi:hypothetical protein
MATDSDGYTMGRRRAIRQMMAGTVGMAAAAGSSAGGDQSGVHLERQSTGSEVWQVTTEERSHSNIYCEVPYCSADSRYFVYHRSRRDDRQNRSEFVVVEIGTWKQRALDAAVSMSGCAMTPDGIFYYLKRVDEDTLDLLRVDLSGGDPEAVHRFQDALWTWSLGTVSPDHRYYLRGKRLDDEWKMFGILLVDLQTGDEKIIDEDPYTFNAHPQFDPGTGRQVMIQHNRGGTFEPGGKRIRSTGPQGATLFLLSVPDGRRTELQVGTPYTTPCTGHEAWIGKTGEMLLTVSARDDYAPEKGNLLAVRAGSPARVVTPGYKFAHVGVSRCGRLYSCDDWQADYNIVIGSNKTGKSAVVCASKTKPTSAQNTHAHPYLTPDLKWVIFNSSRGGFPHIHAASVPDGMVEAVLKT